MLSFAPSLSQRPTFYPLWKLCRERSCWRLLTSHAAHSIVLNVAMGRAHTSACHPTFSTTLGVRLTRGNTRIFQRGEGWDNGIFLTYYRQLHTPSTEPGTKELSEGRTWPRACWVQRLKEATPGRYSVLHEYITGQKRISLNWLKSFLILTLVPLAT